MADRTGNLSDLASNFQASSGQPNVVTTSYIANTIAGKLSETPGSVSQGEPYYYEKNWVVVGPGNPTNNPNIVYPTSCTSTAQCVFPNATIPTSVWSSPAAALLPYFPAPNVGTNEFDSAAENETIRDDKGGIRLDVNTQHWGNFVGYYFADSANVNSPYAYGQGGANVPSGLGGTFNSLTVDHTQLLSLGDVKTLVQLG